MNPSSIRLPLSRLVSRCSFGAALLAAISVAACSKTLDMAGIDKSIREGLVAQLDMPVTSVECPSEARVAKAGDAFTCTVTPQAGGRLTVTVTQKDDQGNVSWEVTRTEGLLDLQKVEAAVTEGLKTQAGLEASVDCQGRWRAATPGDTFACQATTADGQSATVEVTTNDAEGNVSWKVQ